jgi:hypothetical protein
MLLSAIFLVIYQDDKWSKHQDILHCLEILTSSTEKTITSGFPSGYHGKGQKVSQQKVIYE